MSLDLGTLSLKLGVDRSGVSSGMAAARRQVLDFAKRAGGDALQAGETVGRKLGQGVMHGAHAGISGLGRVLSGGVGALTRFGSAGGAALVGLGAAAGVMGVKVAAGNEQADISFTTMLGSARKAHAFLGQLKAFAAATPFDFPGLQTAASSLISVGIKAKDVIPIMTSLGNATSGMGTGAEGVQRATVALQQMNAAGKISAEDLNQLRDAGIPVYDLLTKATGKSTAQIAQMAQTGKLGRKELDQMMAALTSGKGLERFNGLMQKQSQSLVGLWSTMKDTVGQGLANAITPLIPMIKDGLGGASNIAMAALKRVPGVLMAIVNGGKALYAIFAKGDFIGQRMTFGWAEDSKPVDFLFSLREGFISLMHSAQLFWRQTQARESGPLTAALRLIWSSLVALLPLLHNTSGSVAGMSRGFPVLGAVVHGAVAAVQGLARGLAFLASHQELVRHGADTLRSWLHSLGMQVGELWQRVKGFDWGTFVGMVQKLGPMVTNLSGSIPALGPSLDLIGKGLKFVADHADLVGKALPYVAAGFALIKAAQVANQLVGRQSLIGFGIDIAATIARTTSNYALARSLGAVSTATAESTGVENISVLTRARSAIATVAVTVAQKAAALGSRAWAAAQWLLNTALDANPIGLVILAIAGLAAGIIYAYKHSAKFREIVQAVFSWFRKYVPEALTYVWHLIVIAWHGITAAFQAAWSWVSRAFSVAWAGIKYIVTHPLDAARQSLGIIWGAVRGLFSGVWSWVKYWAGAAWAGLRQLITHPIDSARQVISTILGRTGLQRVFSTAVSAVGRIWAGLQNLAKKPISFIINTVLNNGLIPAWNWIAGVLHESKVDPIKIKGYAHGSEYTGAGGKYEPAGIVHRDEAVIQSSSRRRFEASFPGYLKHINETGSLPGYAGGSGFVQAARNSVGEAYDQGYCLRFVTNLPDSGIRPGIYDAITAWHQTRPQHAGQVPNAPAPVYWGGGSQGHGHVAAYVGNNQIVSTDLPTIGRVGLVPLNTPSSKWGLPYLGWTGSGSGSAAFPGLTSGGGGGGFIDYLGMLGGKVKSALSGLTHFGDSPWVKLVSGVPKMIGGWLLDKAKGAITGLFGTADPNSSFGTKGSNRQRGHSLMLQYGFPEAQWSFLDKLWTRESGWNERAMNASSGAYGIPQALPGAKMASVGADWRVNPNTQIMWGLPYIKNRWGSPSGAWAHELSAGWYGNGTLRAAAGIAGVGDGGGEFVLNPQLRNFRGGERVLNNRETTQLLADAERGRGWRGSPLIGEYHEHFPQSLNPLAAAEIAGSRVVAKLSAMGV